jgi:hypothetical protein
VESLQGTSIAKILSRNDSGQTSGHQAGILMPRKPYVLRFFPRLDSSQRNPRAAIVFQDHEGDRWRAEFVHYNSLFFHGTRNEYRLVGIGSFVRKVGLRAGDLVILTRLGRRMYHLDYQRQCGDSP